MSVSEATTLAAAGVVLVAVTFAVSVGLGATVRRWWPGYLSDFPGGALGHRVSVPLSGGFVFWLSCGAVFLAAAVVVVVGRDWLPAQIVRHVDGMWYRSTELGVILGLATVVLLAGTAADLFDLGWRTRLAAQVAVAVALATFGTRVTLFWPFSYPLVGGLVTVLWVVVLVNAFTFLDNMDGLAVGVGLIAAALFAATQVQVGSLFAPAALLIVAGGLAGVWVFNRYPARMFLGTGGSWLVGFLLAALTIAGTYYRYEAGDSRNGVLSPLLVMAVPCYESAVVFLVWLGERDQPFLYNPRHYSYRLRGVGMTPPQSVGLLLLVSLGAGLGSLLLHRLDAFGTAVLLAQTACLIGVVALVEVSAIRRRMSDGRDHPGGPEGLAGSGTHR